MTTTPVLGIFVGALTAVGIVLVVIGAIGWPDSPSVGSSKQSRRSAHGNVRVLIICGVVGGVVALWSSWWAIALLAVLGGAVLPVMVAERAEQLAARKRVSAVASWVETVRDLLSAASGIDEAIARSARALPVTSPIRAEVQALASTAGTGGMRAALGAFAESMGDPTVDFVAATLVIASERSSGLLHEQLSDAARIAREQVSVRERVDASRSRMRTASAAIVAVTVVMVAFVIGTQPSYADWYGRPAGQVVLSVAGAIEIVGMWWMARLARPEPGTRIILELPTAPLGGFR